jgi:A/G-specific adenine glycosylase
LRADCRAAALGLADTLPAKTAKRAKPQRTGHAWWIERDGAVWLVRRPDKGMLGGMRALPDDGWHARADGAGAPPFAGLWRSAGVVRHSFTHFDLDLQLMLCDEADLVHDLPHGPDAEFWPVDRIDEAGLPTVFAKAARLALALR